jgi:hypothetical protein
LRAVSAGAEPFGILLTVKESQSTDFQMFGFKIPKRQRFPDAVAYCVSSKEAR